MTTAATIITAGNVQSFQIDRPKTVSLEGGHSKAANYRSVQQEPALFTALERWRVVDPGVEGHSESMGIRISLRRINQGTKGAL